MKRLLVFLTALMLVGCGPKLKSGEVIGKRHDPESTFVMLMPMFISDGKTTTTIMIPYLVHDDEDFMLRIRGDHEGKLIDETWYVTEEQYKKSEIGDYIGFDAEVATRTDRLEKVRRA